MRKLTKREQKLVAKRDGMLKELSSEFSKDFIDGYVNEAENQDGYEYWNDMNTDDLRQDMVLYAENNEPDPFDLIKEIFNMIITQDLTEDRMEYDIEDLTAAYPELSESQATELYNMIQEHKN